MTGIIRRNSTRMTKKNNFSSEKSTTNVIKNFMTLVKKKITDRKRGHTCINHLSKFRTLVGFKNQTIVVNETKRT